MTLFAHDTGAEGTPIQLKSVLLVEDDLNDLDLAQRELKKLNLRNPIRHAASVDEMIAYLKGEGRFAAREEFPMPVLIMLDMHLAQADGLDAAAWLRSKLKFRNIPIIAISGSGTERLKSAVEMGADGLMQKPLNSGEFRKLITKLKVPLVFNAN
jgi:CheY-like chemotaxis protein